jgi:hypothetical protein
VIDDVFAGASTGAALETAELVDGARMIEQRDPCGC